MDKEAKTVSETCITMAQVMNPEDANPFGNVHGGVVMKLIDTVGGVAAIRHSRCNVVTASIERLDLHQPIYVGDLVTFKASLNFVGKTSMEVGVRVESENPLTGLIRWVASAYLTYVALGEDHRPQEIPELILETDDEKRRNCEARLRREARQRSRENAKLSC